MFIFPTIAVLLFIMFPTPVFADQAGNCGEQMTFSQNGTTLNISGTGKMYDYDQGNSYPWDNNITEVVIGSGVTSIGDYAFTWCSQLKDIEIPATVTSIGNYAFAWCSQLKDIKIPASVISIGEGTFRECSSLTTVYFNDGSKLETIGDSAFARCFQLKDIEIPATVTSIGNAAFEACSNVNVSAINQHFEKKDNAIYSANAK